MKFNKYCTQNLGNSGCKLICKFIAYFEGQIRLVQFGSFGNERLKWSVWVGLAMPKVGASLKVGSK